MNGSPDPELKVIKSVKEQKRGPGEMTWQLRALAARPEDQGSIPKTKVTDANHL